MRQQGVGVPPVRKQGWVIHHATGKCPTGIRQANYRDGAIDRPRHICHISRRHHGSRSHSEHQPDVATQDREQVVQADRAHGRVQLSSVRNRV